MRIPTTVVLCLCPCLYFVALTQAQTTQNPISVPRIVRYTGHVDTPQPRTAGATFSIYKEESGGTPLWSEVQNIQLDEDGSYTSLLGSMHPEGMPVDIFNTTEPRWLEVEVDQVKQPRVLVSSVPYALKAADADTLGGLPASAYLRADRASSDRSRAESGAGSVTPNVLFPSATSGTPGFLGVFTNSTDLGNSAIFQNASGTQVSIGGQASLGALTLIGNVPFSDAPGMALYNQGGGGGASVSLDMYNTSFNNGIPQAKMKAIDDGDYSDNLTFLLKNPGGPGNSLVERMRITSTGRVGIGTANPAALLDVSGTGRFSGGIMFNDGTTQSTAVPSNCGSAQTISFNNSQWNCANASTGGGGGSGITQITTVSPLTGGGTSSNVSIGLTTCSNGQTLLFSGGAWTCSTPSTGGSGITQITAVSPLTGGGTAGNVSIGLTTCSNGQTLLFSGGVWTCSTPATVVSSQWTTNGNNIFYNSGNVGIGTSTPASLLSVNGGIAATGSDASINSGGARGVFDFVANQFVRLGAITGGGSPLPLTFLTNNTERMRIDTAGNVGIGTTAASTLLQVGSGGSTGKVVIDSQDSSLSQLQIANPTSDGEASITYLAGATGVGKSAGTLNGNAGLWEVGPGVNGIGGSRFGFFSGFANQNILTIVGNGALLSSTGASLTPGGVWANASDRNLKENFVPVAPSDILQKIDALPVTEWNYKNEGTSVRHIGPMAQDFYAVFAVGNSDKAISTIDPAGIALAGIQALDAKSTDLEKQLAAKTDEVRSLQERLARLETMFQQLAAQPAR